MNGHQPIVAMRRAGKRPAIVFLNDYPCGQELQWARWGEHATVEVHGDQPELLDLRYLVGLTVSVSAATQERGHRFMEACKKAGAVLIGAGCSEFRDGRYQAVWSDVWRKEA